MRRSWQRGLTVGLAIAAAAGGKVAAQAQPLSRPRAYVEDLAGVVSSDVESRLNERLAALERATGAQVIVLTVQSTDGEDIRTYGIRTAETWKLGQAGKDNGVLVIVAVRDRKYTIETGYGVEHVLTDAFCGAVGRQHFAPHFKRRDYSTGIQNGVTALLDRLEGRTGAADAANSSGDEPPTGIQFNKPVTGCTASIGVFIVILVVVAILGRMQRAARRSWGGYDPVGGDLLGRRGRRRRSGWADMGAWLLWSAIAGSRGGRRGGDGGGFGGFGGSGGFGGGGGGFGGGGGGSFGGGGASGGW